MCSALTQLNTARLLTRRVIAMMTRRLFARSPRAECLGFHPVSRGFAMLARSLGCEQRGAVGRHVGLHVVFWRLRPQRKTTRRGSRFWPPTGRRRTPPCAAREMGVVPTLQSAEGGGSGVGIPRPGAEFSLDYTRTDANRRCFRGHLDRQRTRRAEGIQFVGAVLLHSGTSREPSPPNRPSVPLRSAGGQL